MLMQFQKKVLSDIFGLYVQTVKTIYRSKFCLEIKRFATKFIIIYQIDCKQKIP